MRILIRKVDVLLRSFSTGTALFGKCDYSFYSGGKHLQKISKNIINLIFLLISQRENTSKAAWISVQKNIEDMH